MEKLTKEEIEVVNKLHPDWVERLTDEWIAKNILHYNWEHWKDHRHYLGDYKLLGDAWKAFQKHFSGRNVFIADKDGVYEQTKWDVLYSGQVYSATLQLIWSSEDCERYHLPATPMAMIYGAIITDILENQE